MSASAYGGLPTARLDAQVRGFRNTVTVEGSLAIDVGRLQTVCLYLPYNDPDYGWNHGLSRRLDFLAKAIKKPTYERGRTLLKLPPSGWSADQMTRYIYRFTRASASPAAELAVGFRSMVPRIPMSDGSEIFVDGFHPQLMERCPNEESMRYGQSLEARRKLSLKYQLKVPSSWFYVGLPIEGAGQLHAAQRRLRSLAFALRRERPMILSPVVAGVQVHLVYSSTDFVDLLDTVGRVLPSLTQLLGPLPDRDLVIFESRELQRYNAPGLIAINQPRQQLFRALQDNWINWRHWILASYLANQWFGADVQTLNPRERWLTEGIAEYATLKALQSVPQRYDFFVTEDPNDEAFLSLTYRQAVEMSAALLRRFAPFTQLTTDNFTTQVPLTKQHSLSFVRMTFFMSFLESLLGRPKVASLLQSFRTQHGGRGTSAKEFASFLLDNKLAVSQDNLYSYLRSWWTQPGWPDFVLSDWNYDQLPSGDRFRAWALVENQGAIDFPVHVRFWGDDGHSKKALTQRTSDGAWRAEVELGAQPARVMIDADRSVFDANRFNNSDEWPGVTFFPGNANTLRDDEYTVVWVPYAYRLPGEPLFFALQAIVARYVTSSTSLRLGLSPSEQVTSILGTHLYQFPEYGLDGGLLFTQDHLGDRVMEATIRRQDVFPGGLDVDVGAKLRRRRTVGEPSTLHHTGSLNASVTPIDNLHGVSLMLHGEGELAPAEISRRMTYLRTLGRAQLIAQLPGEVEASSRYFYGSVTSSRTVPQLALFDPQNLDEAAIRIDQRGFTRASHVASVGSQVAFPLILPLPGDSMILSRHLRGVAYYDLGGTWRPRHELRAAGVGISLPMGGDLGGTGSLSFIAINIRAVLFSSVDGIVSRRPPPIFFDIAGQF